MSRTGDLFHRTHPKMLINRSGLCLTLILIIFECVSSVLIRPSKLETFDLCGGEYSGYQYSVTSPDNPKNDSKYQDCIYILQGSHLAKCNQVFHLQFVNFSLRSSPNCEMDYLIIGDKDVFCGDFSGIKTFPSKNNTLTLRFHSGKGGSNTGFKILVTTLPCPVSTEASKSMVNDSKQHSNRIYPTHRLDDVQSTKKEVYPSKINFNNDNQNKITDNQNLFLDNLKPSMYINNKPYTNGTKITTYVFTAPELFEDEKNEIPKYSTDLSIPASKNVISDVKTSQDKVFNFSSRSVEIDTDSRNNQKLIAPEAIYGIPPGKPYAPLPGNNPQIQTGEVYENSPVDCNGRPNINENWHPPTRNDVPGSLPPASFPPGSLPPRNQPPILPPPARIPPSYGPPSIPQPPPFNPPPPQQTPTFPVVPRPPLPPPNQFIPSNADNNSPLGLCCNTEYSAQRFLFSNPGFPSLFLSEKPYDCAYSIIPYPNACRLRFIFKYFNFGIEDDFCRNGFIEIDGRRYCGCKTGLTVVSNVQPTLRKFVRISYIGFPRIKHNGFLIEVRQEFCSNNNYPYLSRKKKEVINEKTEFLKTLTNEHDVIDAIQYFNTTQREKRQVGYDYPKPNVDFSVETIFPVNIKPTPQTTCQATSLLSWAHASKEAYLRGGRCNSNIANGGFVPNIPNNYQPGIVNSEYPGNVNPGYLPPLSGRPVFPNYPGNSGNPGNIIPGYIPPLGLPGLPELGYPGIGAGIFPNNCQYVNLGLREGFLASPGYPNNYPTNVNICFRFIRAPGACKLQLTINDFDLENSQGCTKDFLYFANQNVKYCGRTIAGSKTLIEFPPTNVINVQFVSDAFITGRGFNIGFVQI